MTTFETGRAFADAMDRKDELRRWRDEFNIPPADKGISTLYLCGNSLGVQPKLAARYVNEELEDWSNLAVEGHFRGRRPWLSYHRLATSGLAALTGAKESEVVAMNTLTVNLHLMMATFYRPTRTRYKILLESTVFPSDRFAAMSQLRLHGFDPADGLLEWAPRSGDSELRLEDLERILGTQGDEIALLLLPGVQYYNGQLLDMRSLCKLARDSGCAIGLDLAHAIGNVPMSLHEWGPDFAAWCSYKYLNGGPGAVGGVFIHERHHGDDGRQLLGWWGHSEATRFKMRPQFEPAAGAELWQISNPPIFSLAPVVASLELFAQAGINRLREKSIALTGYLDFLLRQHLHGRIATITPSQERGCQLSLVVNGHGLDPLAVLRRLEEQNVIADWREPNVIRAAPVPLYNSFRDVYEFTQRLAAAVGAPAGPD